MTFTWKVYGIKLIMRSCAATAASSAWLSVTSKETGFASFTPRESFTAFSIFLQPRNHQNPLQYCVGAAHTNCDINPRFGQNIKRRFGNETGATGNLLVRKRLSFRNEVHRHLQQQYAFWSHGCCSYIKAQQTLCKKFPPKDQVTCKLHAPRRIVLVAWSYPSPMYD